MWRLSCFQLRRRLPNLVCECVFASCGEGKRETVTIERKSVSYIHANVSRFHATVSWVEYSQVPVHVLNSLEESLETLLKYLLSPFISFSSI